MLVEVWYTDSDRTKLISYNYDAWGNSKITYHSGSLNSSVNNNPFRYRGYYYDADFGLYYLQTRYYDSTTGRFINADEVSQGTNAIFPNLYIYGNPIPKGMVSVKSMETRIKSNENVISLNENIKSVYRMLTSKTNTIIKESYEEEDEEKVKNIHVKIEFSGIFINIGDYTDQTIEYIESQYSGFLGESTIDREQLYGEILGHYFVYIVTSGKLENANPVDINIYEDGSVKDPRPQINFIADKLGKWFG